MYSKCGQNRIFERIHDFFAKLIKKFQFLLKNSKKFNLQKWPLEVNWGPQSRVMSVLCFAKFQIWKSHWIDGFLNDLNRFFSFKNQERVKMHPIIPLCILPKAFQTLNRKFHNFLGENGSKYIAKNYFYTQNVVRNVYI